MIFGKRISDEDKIAQLEKQRADLGQGYEKQMRIKKLKDDIHNIQMARLKATPLGKISNFASGAVRGIMQQPMQANQTHSKNIAKKTSSGKAQLKAQIKQDNQAFNNIFNKM